MEVTMLEAFRADMSSPGLRLVRLMMIMGILIRMMKIMFTKRVFLVYSGKIKTNIICRNYAFVSGQGSWLHNRGDAGGKWENIWIGEFSRDTHRRPWLGWGREGGEEGNRFSEADCGLDKGRRCWKRVGVFPMFMLQVQQITLCEFSLHQLTFLKCWQLVTIDQCLFLSLPHVMNLMNP